MNPLARLLAQAEVDIGGVARRAVDSAVAPLKAKSQEVVNEALGTVTATARALAFKAAAAVLAAIMLVAALVFAFAALYHYILQRVGPMDAMLIMGGLFLVLAVIAGAVAAALPLTARAAPAGRSGAAAALERPDPRPRPVPDGPPSEGEQALRSGLDAIVSALGEAGFKREQAGLRAGLSIADKLRPMQVVTLALVGGVLAGARMMRRRR